jgi:hypothetical protein
MRKLVSVFAIAAATGLTSLVASSSAAPAAGALALSGAAPLADDNGVVQKVHGWHCGPKKGWYGGRKRVHRHSRACHDYDDHFHSFNLYLGGSRDFYVHGRYRSCHNNPAVPYRFCHYGPGDEF